MEEIEELRAKVVAYMSATGNPNSKLQKNHPKPKEEGELSTSDEDEVHTSSAAQSTGTTTPPVEPSVASGNEKTQSSNMDDDSGSDSEEYKTERTLERKENTLGVDGFKRPSASSHLESENSRQNANNQMKRMPKKVPLNSRYFSSTTKMHGTNSRGSEPVSAEKASPICNSDLINKTYAGQDHVFNQAVSMNNSKLESLRQQIAIRENQLKIHQSKKTISGSLNDYNGFNLNNGAAKKSRPASDKTLQLVSSQPEKKRLKLDEPCQSKLNYVQRQMLVPATKSIPKLKGPLPENIVHKDKILMSRSQYTKEIPLGTTDLSTDFQRGKTDRKMGVSPGHMLAGVKDGESSVSRVETNSRLPNKQGGSCISGADKGTRLSDPSTVLNQTLQLAQMTPRADDGAAWQLKIPSPKNSNTDGSKLHSTFGGPHSSSSFSLNKATQHHNIEKRRECNEVIPSDRILGLSSDNIFEKCLVQVPENKFETSNALVQSWKNGDTMPFIFDTVWDLVKLADYLSQREDIDPSRIGITGESLGGMHAWFAAFVDTRYTVVVPIIGVQGFRWAIDNNKWQARVDSIKPVFEEARVALGKEKIDKEVVGKVWDRIAPGLASNFDSPYSIPVIAPRPLLILNGEEDPRCPLEGLKTPISRAHEAYKAANCPENIKLIAEAGIGHQMTVSMVKEASDWFDRFL